MKQLNLVPIAVQKKLTYVSWAKTAILGVLIGGVAVAAIAAPLHFQVAVSAERVEGAKALDEAAKAEIEKEEKALVGSSENVEKVKQLNLLAKNEVDWEKSFAVIEGLIPQDILLTSYSFAKAPSGVTVKMTGSAPSNLSFAVFVQALHDTGTVISGVKVDGYSYDPKGGSVTFSLTGLLAATAVQFVAPQL